MRNLETKTLAEIGADLPVPSYDRDRVRTGIVHSGSAASTARTRRCTSTR